MGAQQTADISAGRDRTMRRRRRAGIGLLTSILAVFGVAVTDAMADSSTRVIKTTSGPVRGVSDSVVNKFQGIRYANSTAGADRWTPPTAPARSHTVFDATTPGSPCPQQVNQFSPSPPFSEDCLFLNVITPVDAGGDHGLPVWIFIHGGALVPVQARLSTPAFWSALTTSSSSPSIIASERWAGLPIQPWTAMESPATTG